MGTEHDSMVLDNCRVVLLSKHPQSAMKLYPAIFYSFYSFILVLSGYPIQYRINDHQDMIHVLRQVLIAYKGDIILVVGHTIVGDDR